MRKSLFIKNRYIFFGIFWGGLFLGSYLFFFHQKPQDLYLLEEKVMREEEGVDRMEEETEKYILLEEKQEMVFTSPLDNPKERINKKPFGIWIDPQNSPIFPERFSGYHTGVDFEIFSGEEDKDIEVKAMCSGEIFFLQTVNGYGGVILQKCFYEEQSIIVLYGHIDKDRVRFSLGDQVKMGTTLGFLGQGGSEETDGERKHLHLGVIKGEKENFLGYVRAETLLDQWIDPCELICSL